MSNRKKGKAGFILEKGNHNSKCTQKQAAAKGRRGLRGAPAIRTGGDQTPGSDTRPGDPSREGWKARKVSSRAGAKSPNSTVKLACEERVNTVDKILSISVLRETQEDIIPLQER